MSLTGRKGGIEGLNYRDRLSLLERSYAMSKNFKTSAKYGYQPVSINGNSSELVEKYITVVRPTLCEFLGIKRTADDDPLFLNFKGDREKDISKLVTSFFKETLGLCINTTRLRAMVEMEARRLCRDGSITEHHREAIANVSGHSYISTVRDYYLYEQRNADRRDSAVLFEALQEERQLESPSLRRTQEVPVSSTRSVSDTSSSHNPEPSAQQGRIQVFEGVPITWGSKHPHGNIPAAKTIPWSDEEKDYIGKVVKNVRENKDDEIPTNICSIIRKTILDDSEAHEIFHSHHILDTGRIRAGYQAYMKREIKKKVLNNK